MKIILGSKSPRRKELLSQIIDDFEIRVPSIDEIRKKDEPSHDFAERMALEKGEAIVSGLEPYANSSYMVITADTVVAIENIILGKPASFEQAQEYLNLLSGKTHKVVTGITLISKNVSGSTKELTESETTNVKFKKLSSEEIKAYLSQIVYHDKAGAYAIQEKGKLIIEEFKGSLTNIIGFPLRKIFSMLINLNLTDECFLKNL